MTTFSPTDMQLTPAQIYFTPAGATAESYLGGSLKNIKINFGYEKAAIKADQTGTTMLDQRVSGIQVTVSTEIAQINDFEIFSYIFPNATIVGTAPYNTSSPAASAQWLNKVGSSDLALAGNLRLHPQNYAASNTHYDWNFPLAVPKEVSEVTFSPTEQSTWKVEWQVYPDTSSTASTLYPFFTIGS